MADKKKMNIKLLIDKNKNKVLFAESDRNFVEILFNFLTVPIASILPTQSNMGCIDSLYTSVEALDSQYFRSGKHKDMVMKPKNESDTYCRSLELTFDYYANVHEYYYFPTWSCTTEDNCLFSMMENTTCVCGQKMNVMRKMDVEENVVNGVFLKGIGNKYTIYDDLEVRTLSNDKNLSVDLWRFGITDETHLEEMNVSVDIEEMKELMKRSMVSLTALTDVFLPSNTQANTKRIKTEQLDEVKLEPQGNTKIMKLKLVIQKSCNKLLYAVAKPDFLDLLFSFLTYPIGAVVELNGGHSSIGSIDKLYGSVKKMVATTDKEFLLHLQIAAHSSHENQVLEINDQGDVYVHKCLTCHSEKVYQGVCEHGLGTVNLRLVNPKFADTVATVEGGFLKESNPFMISDELVVEPYSQVSGISYLKKHGVAFRDIKERSVNVGEKEVLSLLKASLATKTALTKVFMRKD